MTFKYAKAYAVKSTAVRAARKAGLTHWTVAQTGTGWFVVDTTPKAEPKPFRRRGGPKTRFSSIPKPCTVVREFVRSHRKMPRKDVIAKLVAMGVDKGTANVQYSKAARG